MSSADDSLVELRCAVAVVSRDTVLLQQRYDHGDWVLPGGRPRDHESMQSCARRETREETGLDVHPNRCSIYADTMTSHGRTGDGVSEIFPDNVLGHVVLLAR